MVSENRDKPLPTSSRRIVGRLLLRGVMGFLLIAISYEVITIYFMYRSHVRERQFMRRLEDRGGRATYQTVGPDWIPLSIRGRYWAFLHVNYVDLAGAKGALDFLPELKTLNWLESLSLA